MTATDRLPSEFPEATGDWVYLPVPKDLVAAAYQHIAALLTAAPTTPEAATATPSEHRGTGGPADPEGPGSYATSVGNRNAVWPPSGYARVFASLTVSMNRIRLIGDALAATDDYVSTPALVEATGLTDNEIRHALGKLTQFIEARSDDFGGEVNWPFGWWYGAEIDADNPRVMHYRMSPEQRAAWQTARAADPRRALRD